MKTWITSLLAFGCAVTGWGATTIDSMNKFAYGANFGWLNWRGDDPGGANGAVIGEFYCSGFIYAANAGWIHLGDGSPLNGVHYQNNSPNDYGVNLEGLGNLRGLGYGANIGWVNFEDVGAPKIDLLTGIFSGHVWGANVGWISLSNALAYVQTSLIQSGPDSDNDGLPDAWERAHVRDLSTLDADGDNDGDGQSNLGEYLADTDPLNAGSQLRLTLVEASAGGSRTAITWTSQPTRLYRIQQRRDLNPLSPWSDIGLGLITPDPSANTTRMFEPLPFPQRFFRIEAIKPLTSPRPSDDESRRPLERDLR